MGVKIGGSKELSVKQLKGQLRCCQGVSKMSSGTSRESPGRDWAFVLRAVNNITKVRAAMIKMVCLKAALAEGGLKTFGQVESINVKLIVSPDLYLC